MTLGKIDGAYARNKPKDLLAALQGLTAIASPPTPESIIRKATSSAQLASTQDLLGRQSPSLQVRLILRGPPQAAQQLRANFPSLSLRRRSLRLQVASPVMKTTTAMTRSRSPNRPTPTNARHRPGREWPLPQSSHRRPSQTCFNSERSRRSGSRSMRMPISRQAPWRSPEEI